jgi:hypothetical protein
VPLAGETVGEGFDGGLSPGGILAAGLVFTHRWVTTGAVVWTGREPAGWPERDTWPT